MKKYKLILMFLILFLNLLIINNVYAEASLSINANTYTVYVGNSVTVKLSINELSGRFKVYSTDSSVIAGGAEGWCDNNICENGMSTSLVFKANKVGTAVIRLEPVNVSVTTPGKERDFTESRSITINVINKVSPPSVDVNKVYSKNNYLKNLIVDGYELNPKFNKETLEYEVELEPGTEKINVSAVKEDWRARIKGTGEIGVTEGINTINIVVTAENGNERTYKIIARVDEKDPINIKIEGKDYTIIKKKELINSKSGYEESSVKIKSFDIPSLYNNVTNITLIGVKDSEGNISLVSYDSKTGEYNYYNEFKFDLMNLYIHEKEDSKYEKIDLRINGVKTIGYKLNGLNDYYLVYATNTITGYDGYYLYDIKENSVQRYTTKLLDNMTDTKDKYFSMVLVLSCVCFLTMLFLLIEVNRDNKRKFEE